MESRRRVGIVRVGRPAARVAGITAAIVVLSIIAVALSARSTGEPGVVARHAGPTTTTRAESQDQASAAWIEAHGGRVVPLQEVFNVAASGNAFYVLSHAGSATDPPATMSRIDPESLRVVSVHETPAGGTVAAGANAVFRVFRRGTGRALERLDPETLHPMWTTALPAPNGNSSPEPVAGDDKVVWVSLGDHLDQLDARSGRVLRSIPASVSGDTAMSIALDPTGQSLYIAYGQGAGLVEPIERRDASTGARLAFKAAGTGGLGAPHIVATTTGVWAAAQYGSTAGADFYTASDLTRSQSLVVGGTRFFGMGVDLAPTDTTLWVANIQFVACDAANGTAIHELGLTEQGGETIEAGPIAALPQYVAVVVSGVLGIFTPRALCPNPTG